MGEARVDLFALCGAGDLSLEFHLRDDNVVALRDFRKRRIQPPGEEDVGVSCRGCKGVARGVGDGCVGVTALCGSGDAEAIRTREGVLKL